MEYCIATWSLHYAKDEELTERIQRHFTKLMLNMSSLPYKERLKRTGLWTFRRSTSQSWCNRSV